MRSQLSTPAVTPPRAQTGPSPQHLLATLFGEYLESPDAEVPSAAIVAILAEFGISEYSARTALSRLTKRGLIRMHRAGRSPTYALTTEALARHRSRMNHFLRFGDGSAPWTGVWTVVSFSLPERRHSHRHHVRRTLGDYGFARLYDSVWIRPGSDRLGLPAVLQEIVAGVEGAKLSVMQATFDDGEGLLGPAAAFDLDRLREGYEAFVDRYTPLVTAIRRQGVGPREALVARTSLMSDWRVFPDADPNLPAHLLPQPWPLAEARALFVEAHTALGPLARDRLVAVARPTWPAAETFVTYFTVPSGSDG